MKLSEIIKNKEVKKKADILSSQMDRKLCYYFVFSNPIAFRDYWAPEIKKMKYKTRFYQYGPALSIDVSWGGARTLGKSDELVFSMIYNCIRSKMKSSLLTAFRKIHVKDRMEALISGIMNSLYLRKLLKGNADKSLHGAVSRTPGYTVNFKNGHELKGISIGDDPAAVMIQGSHPHYRYIEESVAGESKVLLANDNESKFISEEATIKELVESKKPCNVLSWNIDKGIFESKPVTHFFERERKRELLEIQVMKSCGGKRKYFLLRCTPDHKIFTPSGYKRAGELTEDDEVFISEEDYNKGKKEWSEDDDLKLKKSVKIHKSFSKSCPEVASAICHLRVGVHTSTHSCKNPLFLKSPYDISVV